MTYETAMEYIETIGKRGSVLGLDSIKELLRRLGNPQDALPVIHVAGTNGKGSICAFLEAMYRAEGRQVGRYLSPTLNCYEERIQVGGIYIRKEVFAELLTEVAEQIVDMGREGFSAPTVFEVETAVSFLYFVEERADIVILETGMGGRLDATNVVAKPLCTVFASIGMDHMQFLGDSLLQIAHEKAGIIKDGCPAVSYPNRREVLEVLERECSLHNAGFDAVSPEEIVVLEEDLYGSRFDYKGVEYAISLAGEYQIYNAATAIEAKRLLDGTLDETSLHNVKWEGRFEVVSKHPLLLRDGAHNVDGVKALKKNIEKHFTNRKIIFIIGVLKDKEYEKMMSILCPMAAEVFTVTPSVPRGLSASVLGESVRNYCPCVTSCRSVEQALSYARKAYAAYETAGVDAVIVAWGSLSYIGQIASGERV